MTDRPIAANDWKQSGVTTTVLIRRALFALVALLSLGALSLAALPWVASTQLVRNRIAIELSAWSGFRVAIASTPQIEVFPTFKAVLAGVTLYQWGDWERLETLLAVSEDEFEETPEELQRLQTRLKQLSLDLQQLRQTFPFSLAQQLEDKAWLEQQVAQLKLEIVLERQRLAKVDSVLQEFRL